ncbi:hypothetical protein ACWD9K_31270 [Streptomyces sp. 900116325]
MGGGSVRGSRTDPRQTLGGTACGLWAADARGIRMRVSEKGVRDALTQGLFDSTVPFEVTSVIRYVEQSGNDQER